jgi:hypothetical protein
MLHLPPHINPSTEMGHREAMTTIVVAVSFPATLHLNPVSPFLPAGVRRPPPGGRQYPLPGDPGFYVVPPPACHQRHDDQEHGVRARGVAGSPRTLPTQTRFADASQALTHTYFPAMSYCQMEIKLC